MLATVDVGFEGDGAVAVDAAGIAVKRRIFLRQHRAPMRFAFQMDIELRSGFAIHFADVAIEAGFFYFRFATLHSGLKLYEIDAFISYKKTTSEVVSKVNAAEGASEPSSPEQANE